MIKRLIQRHKKTFFFIADAIVIALSVYFAFLMRFEGKIPSQYGIIIIRLVLLFWLFYLPAFYFQKLYSLSWSYVSLRDLVSLFKASSISFLLLVAVFFIFRDYRFFSGFPRSTIIISYFFIFLMAGGSRFAKRFYLQFFQPVTAEKKERTLIVGAGEAGEQIARSIVNSKTSPYLAVGFIDDNKQKWGSLIHGIEVLGPTEKIPEIIKSQAVEEMIIALPSAGTKAIKRAVEFGREAGLEKIKVAPSINEVINGKISLANVRQVEVEDLLERDPVALDTGAIDRFVKNKIILVTGGAGSIGSELCRQIAKFHPGELLILDQDETGIFNISKEIKENFSHLKIQCFVANICDRIKINQIFKQFNPSVVFHAAAYKHVPLMEEQPEEAVKNNIFGTKIIGETALEFHAEKFIFISTDKAVNPISIMGASKRIGEMLCQSFNQKNTTRFVSVRFGNVLNSRGSVIPIFREQIKKGGPVEVTHPDMTRYFMLISEACLLVLEAGAMGQGGEVFVLDMGRSVKILDLAREMIRLSGFEPDKDIPIVFIGVRPGEKIFEEILTAEEGTVATQNEKIFTARLSSAEEQKLSVGLEKLDQAAKRRDQKEITIILKELIPVYSPCTK